MDLGSIKLKTRGELSLAAAKLQNLMNAFLFRWMSISMLSCFVFSSNISAESISVMLKEKSSRSSSELRRMTKQELTTESSLRWRSVEIEYSNEDELQEKLQDLAQDAEDWEIESTFSANIINEQIDVNFDDFDTYFAQQWSLYNPIRADSNGFSGGDIDLVRAQNYLQSLGKPLGFGLSVVVDSGIDFNSPEFSDRIVGAYNAQSPSDEAFDNNSHGTHVASVVGAARNQFGITGIAPDVEFFISKALNENNEGRTSDVVSGVQKARQYFDIYKSERPNQKHRASGNFSLGSESFSQSLKEALSSFSRDEFLIIASSGNANRDNDVNAYYPCNYDIPNLVCVGASDQQDFRTGFSNYGRTTVDLFAPGLDILGAIPGNFDGSNYSGLYAKKSGTSQSAPHVSGVAHLIWAVNPDLTATEVKQILINSVDRLPGTENEVLSGGRLNAYRAVLIANGDDASLADRAFASTSGGGGCSLANSQKSSHEANFFFWGLFGLCAFMLCFRKRSIS